MKLKCVYYCENCKKVTGLFVNVITRSIALRAGKLFVLWYEVMTELCKYNGDAFKVEQIRKHGGYKLFSNAIENFVECPRIFVCEMCFCGITLH